MPIGHAAKPSARGTRERFVPADKVTLAEWLTSWLERHYSEGHIGAKAHDRYRVVIQRHVIPSLGRLKLQDLRPDHIADMKARWLSGERSTAARPLSGATVHKHLVVLRRALSEAVRSRIISRNPADVVPAPSVKSRTERRALTEDEIKLLVSAAKGSRYNIPIRFTLATGVRQGELLGLKWEDVDLGAGAVSIRRTLLRARRSSPRPRPSAVGGSSSCRRPASASYGSIEWNKRSSA